MLAAEFQSKGKQVLDSLDRLIALANRGSLEKQSSEAVMAQIRQGSPIVYLEQARDTVTRLRDTNDRDEIDGVRILRKSSQVSRQRLALGATAIFGLMLIALVWIARRPK
jgi:hypothetical protein